MPLANFGSTAAWPVFILGLIMSLRPLVMAGIVLFTLAVLFQLVTLPVEFNASARAIKVLESTSMLGSTEIDGAKKVLRAAAHDLCGKPGSFCFTAFKTDYSGRRKKRP